MHQTAVPPDRLTQTKVEFTLDTIKVRPLQNVADLILLNTYNGLEKLPEKRLSAGAYCRKGLVCAVGAMTVNFKASKNCVSFATARTMIEGSEGSYAGALANECWDVGTGWMALSHGLNDRFGKGFHQNDPAVQKARYYYVFGVVASELALRGLL